MITSRKAVLYNLILPFVNRFLLSLVFSVL